MPNLTLTSLHNPLPCRAPNLTKAWNNDERVASLKIVIQLSKLLGDTHMPQFYPAMFVIVITELERFGDMVFTRLRDKAEEGIREGLLTSNRANTPAHYLLAENFRASDIPASTKEGDPPRFISTPIMNPFSNSIYPFNNIYPYTSANNASQPLCSPKCVAIGSTKRPVFVNCFHGCS